MAETEHKQRWGAMQRLEFIDFSFYWEGSINRSNIMSRFRVSGQQASNDLTEYQNLAPTNLRYDLRTKRYEATETFECRLIKPDADRYLGQLNALTARLVNPEDTWLGTTPVADLIPVPTRRVDPEILRAILRSIRSEKSIEIQYQSLSSATSEAVWRRITPHAFASDGFRWHVRAFCHRDMRFKDFLLSRCRDTRGEDAPGADRTNDEQWRTYFGVELIPNPKLTEWEQKAIELDYGMFNGRVVLQVRKALLYYFDKRFRNELASRQDQKSGEDPKERPIAIANLDAYEIALGGPAAT
jgi:hypothetical protein